jgi:hypothetical protein
VMKGDLIYPHQTYPQYPTANTVQSYYPPPTPQPQHFLSTPLALVSHATTTPTTPWPMGINTPTLPLHLVHLPPHHQTKNATDNKARSKARNASISLRRRRAPLNPNTNLPRTSLTRPSKQHFYCHFHGWVTTHGWPSGHGGYHGDPCQFMKSRPSVPSSPLPC